MVRQEHQRLRRLFGLLLAAGCNTREIGADATMLDVTGDDPATDSPVDATIHDGGPDVFCGVGVVLRTDGGFDVAEIDVDPGCEYSFPCGLPDGMVLVGCDIYAPGTGPLDARAFGCWVAEGAGCLDGSIVPANGTTVVDCLDCLGGSGRGSSGVAALEPVRARSRRGAYFVRTAHDEAASVYAFERFERELAHHGAPMELLRAARAARHDEVRHARMMSAHARRLGEEPRTPRIRRSRRVRSLEAIARENAIEGAVRETFAALVMSWEASHGAPEYRKTFAAIAADETRHAALAHAAARWMDARLAPRARARIAKARRMAADELLARPSVAAIVRRFFGDDDVVHVALAQTLRGDAHEA